MSQKYKMQPVRGTRDIFGPQVQAFNHVLKHAYARANLHNYQDLLLPIFEFSEVFHRSLGETSDIIGKETYTFLDRDQSSITLRPEFTASIVRSVISNGLTQSLPLRYFIQGPLFRHERPQKARYRQFHQVDFENIGIAEPYADVEIIELAHAFLQDLGLIDDLTLELSTIGDIESRLQYKEQLVAYLSQYESSLSSDSQNRLYKNPLRILDSKDATDQNILIGAPSIYGCLTSAAAERFAYIQEQLTKLNIKFVLNPKLVRGLDYYTHTVFEFTTTKLGSQSTVLAGGRYDGLFALMGGPSIPAIGFAAGIERLAELCHDTLPPSSKPLLFLTPIGENCLKMCAALARELRSAGIATDYAYHANLGKQIQKADKGGATHILIFGENEVAQKIFKLKDLRSGHETTCALSEVIDTLQNSVQ